MSSVQSIHLIQVWQQKNVIYVEQFLWWTHVQLEVILFICILFNAYQLILISIND